MANGTTTQQDKKFIEEIVKPAIESTLLEGAIEWISKEFAPDDIFDEDVLQTWALENGFTKDE